MKKALVAISACILCFVNLTISQIVDVSRSKRGKYPRIEFYRSKETDDNLVTFQSLGFDNDQIQCLVKAFPSILTEKRIGPKLAFLKRTILRLPDSNEGCDDGLVSTIHKFPEYFRFSLETVIGPRHAFTVANLHHYSTNFLMENNWTGLKSMLAGTDEEFCAHFLSKDHLSNDYQSFKRTYLKGGLAAARASDAKMLKLLCEHGYDPSSDLDRNRASVLMWAAAQGLQQGSLETVQFLVEEARMSVEDISNGGNSVMHWAVQGGSLDVCKYLWSKGNFSREALPINDEGTSLLHWAVGSGAAAVVDWLLDDVCATRTVREAELQRKNRFGCTAVHFASSGGQISTASELLARGVDFSVCNYHGHDAITKAIAFKKNDILIWLLENVPEAMASLQTLRPWDNDVKSLSEIARIVNNTEAISILASWCKVQTRAMG